MSPTPSLLPSAKDRFFSSSTIWLAGVLFLGVLIRWIALANIQIINPDGVLYIYQAKAIFNGQWNLLNECSLSYVSLYPFLIALFHGVVSRWILSAQLVSFTFGSAMLIPLYFLLRAFFNQTISRLTTLLFAFIPVFVRYSVDAMRDPVYWFLFTAAMYAVVVCHTRRNISTFKKFALSVAGGVLVLLAALTRIEAIILYPATCLFILLARGESKVVRLLGLLFPLVFFGMLGLGVSIHFGIDFLSLVRVDDIVQDVTGPLISYHTLRSGLAVLSHMHNDSTLGAFLANARYSVWLIALGVIFNNALEAYFYPYLPFFIVGIRAAWKASINRSAMLFPTLLLVFALPLLYAHVLQDWIMTYRFIVLLIIPSSMLAGFGIEKCIAWMKKALNLPEFKVVAILAIFIVAVGAAKSVKTIEGDKAVYPKIGRTISRLAADAYPIGVAGRPSTAHQWIVFYANVASSIPVCPKSYEVSPRSMADLKAWMRSNRVVYFLWEASKWGKSSFGRQPDVFAHDFTELGRYYHRDTGSMVLFRLKPGH